MQFFYRMLLFVFCLTTHASTLAQDTTKVFMFGHSLLDHRPPAIPTPSDETTVAHWVYLIAQEAGYNFAAGGNYGFLPQHANNLPPGSQWGYDIVPGVYDADIETFAEADITDIVITAGNFIQGQPPHHMYYGPDSIYNPISATRTVMDWVTNEEDSLRIYIYENWPEMSVAFPPSPAELMDYHNQTLGAFHDWWIEYQDSLLDQRPQDNIRMIPAGPIMASLLSTTMLSSIPVEELYEDGDPHGRASLYFLAGLVTYMSMYEEEAPLTLAMDTILHETIANNYAFIVNFIWTELLNFNDDVGNSRVFFENQSSVDVILESDGITLYPNPTAGIFKIEGLTADFHVDVLDTAGMVYQNYNSSSDITIDISTLPSGLYFIRIENILNGNFYLEKILKE